MFGSWNPSQFKYQSASGLIKKAAGYAALQGVLAATSSSAIIQVWDTPTDETDALAVQVTGSITLTAGQSYPIPSKINQGIYIKLVNGSGTWTVFYD